MTGCLHDLGWKVDMTARSLLHSYPDIVEVVRAGDGRPGPARSPVLQLHPQPFPTDPLPLSHLRLPPASPSLLSCSSPCLGACGASPLLVPTFCVARSRTCAIFFGGASRLPFFVIPPFLRPPLGALLLSFPAPCAIVLELWSGVVGVTACVVEIFVRVGWQF